jgi:activator of 2-hydroxyglutaryl-CoA dehydratase
MVTSIGIEGEVTLTGGVAHNKGLVALLEEKLGLTLNIPENPQTVGALGGAHIARRAYHISLESGTN